MVEGCPAPRGSGIRPVAGRRGVAHVCRLLHLVVDMSRTQSGRPSHGGHASRRRPRSSAARLPVGCATREGVTRLARRHPPAAGTTAGGLLVPGVVTAPVSGGASAALGRGGARRHRSASSRIAAVGTHGDAGGARLVPRFGLSVIAGALLFASFPPLGLWWAAPLGVATLLRAVDGLRPGQAWVVAAAGFLSMFLPLLEWVRFLGVGPWLALAVLQAGVAGLLGPLAVLIARWAGCRAVLRSVGLVGAVVAVEGLRARAPFGGLTWGRLAFGQSDGPLLEWAALGGAPLVGAGVAVLGLGLLEAVHGRPRVALPLLALPLLGATAVPVPTTGQPLEVAAVQGDVPRSGIGAFAEDLLVLGNHVRQTRRLAAEVDAGLRPRPDLVVWPENASDQDPRTEPESRALLDEASSAIGQPFLLGAVLREPGDQLSNGLLVWGEDGVQGTVYRKKHLVPFGEYLPLRSLVERLYPDARTLLARDFRPGARVGLVLLNGVPLAVGTCFEVAFDDLPREAVRAGGELLVLPSNNASYGRSAQSAQQLAMARLRAVEHGRSTVVPTTSGISALIAPDGRVVERSRLFEPALLQAALPRRTALTVATRWGAQVEAGLVALLLVPVVPGLARRLSRRPRTATAS